MRTGFISDVHGNLEALRVCLAHLDAAAATRLVFLGDAVGYGANPNEVCDLIRSRAALCVLGNHDAAVSGRMDYSGYYEAARQSLDWCQRQLSGANLAWLAALPYACAADDGRVAFCHGAPAVPEAFDYLVTAEQVAQMLPRAAPLPPVTFIGHSHLPLCFAIDGTTVTASSAPTQRLEGGLRHIVTVGSVGQPRDRDPRACCGTYDSDTQTFAFHRLAYDVATTRHKILEAGLPSMFGDRLLLGM